MEESKREEVLELVRELEKVAATKLGSKLKYKLQEEGSRGWFDLKTSEDNGDGSTSYVVEIFKNIDDALNELDFTSGEFPEVNYRVVPVFTPGEWDPYE